MSKNRPAVLMFILLALLAFYFYETNMSIFQIAPKVPTILPGENAITDVNVFIDENGDYKVKIDYFFTGNPSYIYFTAEAKVLSGTKSFSGRQAALKGKNSCVINIINPRYIDVEVASTHSIVVAAHGPDSLILQKEIPYDIEWNTREEAGLKRKIANTSKEDLYNESVSLIDEGNSESVRLAEVYLNQIILKDASFAPAYVELARISMKMNWNDEGLFQAEKNILSSLQIDGVNPNAKVLLGYVYVHQKKYKQAEKYFIEAEQLGTKNLWLWSNWGELYKFQDNKSAAIEKYLKAIEGVRPFNTYDRARLDAYRNLFSLLSSATQKEQLDGLYKKRAEEYPNSPCFNVDLANYRLSAFGDFASAIAYSQKAVDSGCTENKAKKTMGLANYYAWNSNSDIGSMAKAHAFYPESAALFYDLAQSDKGVKLLKKLLSTGTSVDVVDNEGRSALSLALFNKDSLTAKRLIGVGANVNLLLGDEQFPISFIPLMFNDEQSIRLMKDSGIDYLKTKFRELNGVEYSRMIRSRSLSDELGKKNI